MSFCISFVLNAKSKGNMVILENLYLAYLKKWDDCEAQYSYFTG